MVNFPCQSGACIYIQISAQKLHRKIVEKGWLDKCKIVFFVHDEIGLEVDQEIAHEAQDLLMDCLENTVEIGVPCPAESSIAYGPDFEGECSRGYSSGSYASCK